MHKELGKKFNKVCEDVKDMEQNIKDMQKNERNYLNERETNMILQKQKEIDIKRQKENLEIMKINNSRDLIAA